MIQKFIIHKHHPRLLIFFAGWGADETPFKTYCPPESDYLICYDYRTLDFDPSVLNEYHEINVVGWSMGVWAAAQTLGLWLKQKACPSPFSRCIAINGTEYPIDDLRGIPSVIYQGTLEGLTGASLHKFLRRMCANGTVFKKFLDVTPRRPLEELKEELIQIKKEYHSQPSISQFHWTEAVIGSNDRIIPPDNQLRAWLEVSNTYAQKTENKETILANTLTLHRTEDAHYQSELFKHYLEETWTSNL